MRAERPVLWLRPVVTRGILQAHLRHLAGAFAAAGWEVMRGERCEPPVEAPLAVLDDPWLELLPIVADCLARQPISGGPSWRVPLISDMAVPQGWRPRFLPGTIHKYEAQAWRERGARAFRLATPECGFAVAVAGEAPELVRRGWPPVGTDVAVVPRARVYRYSDPASHERREIDPFVPDDARTVVDVGCGRGLLGGRLRRAGRVVVGIEPDWEVAREAAGRLDAVLPMLAEEGLRALRSGVDCVIFADVLEHTVDPAAVLTQAAGLLTPPGRIVVSIPNAAWAPVVEALAAGRWDYTLAGVQARDHLFFTTPASFARLAAECGLSVRQARPLPAPLPWRQRLWAWLAARSAGGDPSALAAPQWVMVLARP